MRPIHTSLIILLAISGMLAGCETTQSRINKNQDYFGSLPPAQQELIRKKEISVGFAELDVYLAWGRPNRRIKSEDTAGSSETWIYTRIEDYRPHYYAPWYYHRPYQHHWRLWDPFWDPFYFGREFVVKEVVLRNGRVETWSVYDGNMPLRDYFQ